MSIFSGSSLVTSGYSGNSGSPITTGGLTGNISPPPTVPSSTEVPYSLNPSTLAANTNPSPQSLNPSSNLNPVSQSYSSQQGTLSTSINYITGTSVYTGSCIKAMLEFPNQTGSPKGIKLLKQLIELTTISVSVHRVKSPAVAMGYINPKGWARGRRTIAGTVVFNKFTADILSDFLGFEYLSSDVSKDTNLVKVDQLPAFNLTLLFEDEYGNASYQRLLGVELVTSGDTYSIQDQLSEQVISYVAQDFTPLLPLHQPSSFQTKLFDPTTNTQNTPGSVISRSNNPNYPSSFISQPVVPSYTPSGSTGQQWSVYGGGN